VRGRTIGGAPFVSGRWSPRHEQQIADNVCERLLGRTRHVISGAELMMHARQAVRELRESINLDELAEMACLLVLARLDAPPGP
jgi:hypothetical protein